jgi:hypothetical protein
MSQWLTSDDATRQPLDVSGPATVAGRPVRVES